MDTGIVLSVLYKTLRKKEPLRIPFAVRDKIRTRDLLVRSQTLYPAELHVHIYVVYLTTKKILNHPILFVNRISKISKPSEMSRINASNIRFLNLLRSIRQKCRKTQNPRFHLRTQAPGKSAWQPLRGDRPPHRRSRWKG